MARALYNGCATFLLDDILSALDADTKNQVFENLFGHEGYLSGKTVVMTTNDTTRLCQAQYIIQLTKGKVVKQGSPETFWIESQQSTRRSVGSVLQEQRQPDAEDACQDLAADGDDADEAVFMRGNLFSSGSDF